MPETVSLRDGALSVLVRPDLGAGLAAFDFEGDNGTEPVLRRAPVDCTEPFALACNLLVPWSNRISGGGFRFRGTFHALPPNLAGEAFPIHGAAFASRWALLEHDARSARLQLRSEGPGPFAFEVQVHYEIHAGSLDVSLSVSNCAAVPLPYGFGLHPWLPRNAATRLHASATSVWLEDKQHLPIESVPLARRPGWDFRHGAPLPAEWINNAFDGWDGAATVEWPDRGLALDLRCSPALSTFIVYSPDKGADFFCFEPVSHPVDAHNLPGRIDRHGLVVLSPGQSLEANCRFTPRTMAATGIICCQSENCCRA